MACLTVINYSMASRQLIFSPNFLDSPLSYIAKPEKRKDKKEKNNVKLQTRKTNYSTQKPTSLQSLVHRLTTMS